MKAFFLFSALVLAAACPSPPNPPPAPPSVTDAPPGPGTCAAVCAHYAALGCPAARPTPHGATCEAVCLNAQPIAHWNLACRSQAPSCAAADACEMQ